MVDPNFSAEQLVNDVFASGDCELITNIQGIGSSNGIGFFSGGANIFGFDRGIILSTGHVNSAPGPNTTNDTGSELEGQTGDIDLVRIAEEAVFDRVGLEFDFVPLDSSVTFRFVFASEEYCEFINSDYNDVFGFFVSGPGMNGAFTNGAINAALVPGTDDAVSINTINHTVNADQYQPNELNSDQQACNLPIVDNPQIPFLAYDGFTQVLTASLKLYPCETYHMRLVIADVGDENYDSAVMLEAGSFDLGGEVTLQPTGADSLSNILYEGCENAGFRVSRTPGSSLESDQTIAYRFGSNSEAQEGVDFINPGGFATIPAGQEFTDVIIPTIDDGIIEAPESIWLFLDIPCACYTDSILITLVDPGPLAINLEEAYYCPDEMATLMPDVSGGSPPYSYDWSFGSTDEMPTLSPPLPLNISLTVTDDCGRTASRQINTFSSTPPAAQLLTSDFNACWGDMRELEIELAGRPPFSLTYSRNNGDQTTIESQTDGRLSIPVNLGGTYRLVSVTDQACSGPTSGTTVANFYRPVINPDVDNPNCANEPNGRISIQHLSSVPPYSYVWSGTNETGLLADSLQPGIYGITITDALGCSDSRTFDLRGPTPIEPVEITCPQVRRPPMVLSANGGQAPYTYSVDNGNSFFVADSFHLLIPGQYYTLIIRDANGCELLQPNFFYPEATPRNTTLPVFIGQELGGSTAVNPDYRVPYDQVQSVQWHPSEYYDCDTCRTPIISAPYSQAISLVVTDIYGCKDSLATWLGVDGRVPVYIPNVFSPNGDGTNDFVAIYANIEQVAQVLQFRIFDRWGNQVWEDQDFAPNDAHRGWNGLINNELAPAAVYPWTATFQLTNGDIVKETGSVMLMR